MDLENQKRVKDFADQYGPENVVVLLGAAEGEGAGLAAETVTNGDPTFAGPLTGVQLGLTVYHICEPEIKAEVDPAVYDDQGRYDGNGSGCRRHRFRDERYPQRLLQIPLNRSDRWCGDVVMYHHVPHHLFSLFLQDGKVPFLLSGMTKCLAK